MPDSVVPYARFVEAQRRRARIVAAFSRPRETRALRTRPAAPDEPVDAAKRPGPDVGGKITRGVVDGR